MVVGVHELREAEHADLPTGMQQPGNAVDEVAVVAGQQDVTAAVLDRVERPLDADVDDLLVDTARERDRSIVECEQGLNEAGGQLTGRRVEEEQRGDRLLPRLDRELQDALPPGPFVRVRAPIEQAATQRAVDVLTIDEQVGGASGFDHAGDDTKRIGDVV